MRRDIQNLVRLAVFCLAAMLLYWQVFAHKDMRVLFLQLFEALQGPIQIPLLLVALLTWLNWSIEAIKWRMLMRPIVRMSYWRALKATVAGTSLTLITPNRTGEFIGRVVFIPDGQRVAAAVATALGSIGQLVVTLVAGCVALTTMYFAGLTLPIPQNLATQVLIVLAITVATTSLLFYFHPRLIHQLLVVLPILSRWERHFQVLMEFNTEQLLRVLILSAIRYFVFTMQFVVLLIVFDTGLSVLQAALAVPVIYLVTTLLPTVLLTELGVRGSAAIAMLSPLGATDGSVLLATFCIWSFNLLIPALVGVGILGGMRYGDTKEVLK